MYPISKALEEALGSNVTYNTRIEISNDGKSWIDIGKAVTSGDITYNSTNTAHWQSTITLNSKKLEINPSYINTLTTRFRLTRLCRIPRLGVEEIPWGVYRLDNKTVVTKKGTITLPGYSFEKKIEDHRFVLPRKFPKQLLKELVYTLVSEVEPGARVLWYTDKANEYIGSFYEEKDRYSILMGSSNDKPSLSVAYNLLMGFDNSGNFAIKDKPKIDPNNIAWTDTLLKRLSVEESFNDTREQLYNVLVVSGISSGENKPPLGPVVVWDNNPSSLTYAGSDPSNYAPSSQFGIVPRYYKSPLFTNINQLRQTGTSLLSESLMVKSKVTLTGIGHPGLQPGDTMQTSYGLNLLLGWSSNLDNVNMTFELEASKDNIGDIEVNDVASETNL